MKLNKIFALALAAIAFTACSDDEKYNTTPGVSVEMGDATMLLPEDQPSSAAYYRIPVRVVCDGAEANGPIQVTIGFSEPNAELGLIPAKAGENFIFTDTTITIPAGEEYGYFEMYPKGDTEANENRGFMIEIKSVNGAKVGAQSAMLVTLIDNELMIQEAYKAIPGVWTLTAEGPGVDYEYPVIIEGFPEDSPYFQKVLKIVGIMDGVEESTILASISCDPTTGETTLGIANGQTVMEGLVTSNMGTIDIASYTVLVEGNTLYINSAGLVGTSDSELKKFVFPEDEGLYFYNKATGGGRDYDLNIVLTRAE